jgi:hypothetical protein
LISGFPTMSPKDEDGVSLDEGSPPDSPKELEIVAFDATTATLKWKAPENVKISSFVTFPQKVFDFIFLHLGWWSSYKRILH